MTAAENDPVVAELSAVRRAINSLIGTARLIALLLFIILLNTCDNF